VNAGWSRSWCCPDVATTQAVAAAVAGLVEVGDVLLLDGELGAGKTAFTQGLAAAMGVTEAVTSPTFTLVRHYPAPGGIELLHADVYRLDRLDEIVALGLPELIEERAVAVVEWGERAAPALAPDYLVVRLEETGGEGERTVSLRPVGERWLARAERLGEAVEAVAAEAVAGGPAVAASWGASHGYPPAGGGVAEEGRPE